MNRSITNRIRFILDELIPPVVRDTRFFMYPAYFVFFRGKIPSGYIDFKSLSVNMSDQEMEKYYAFVGYYGRNRESDLSNEVEEYIFKRIDKKTDTMLDVGCGGGYFLKKAKSLGYMVEGCDIMDTLEGEDYKYTRCSAERLAFSDKRFDVVTCFHTLEHVRDIQVAIKEIKRVARKEVVIVVPCQRYYRYTVDLHLHFFPDEESLIRQMGLSRFYCKKIGGDLLYVGRID